MTIIMFGFFQSRPQSCLHIVREGPDTGFGAGLDAGFGAGMGGKGAGFGAGGPAAAWGGDQGLS